MARPKSNGPYAKLSAGYYLDDAILDAGPEAELLFVRCLAFTATSSSDGFITERQMKTVGLGLRNLPRRIDSLLRVGVLVHEDGGFLIRGWLKWNKSAAEIGRELRRDRERKARKHAAEPVDSDRNPVGIQPDSSPQYKSNQVNSSSAPSALESTFDSAWAHWPKKVERKQALERFIKAAKTIDPDVLAGHIIRFGDAYKAAGTETQFIPGLGVWLNRERWTDELPQPRANATPTKPQTRKVPANEEWMWR